MWSTLIYGNLIGIVTMGIYNHMMFGITYTLEKSSPNKTVTDDPFEVRHMRH